MLVNSLRPPGGTSQEAQSLYYGEQGRGVIRGPEAPVGEPPKILSRDERYNKGDFMIVTSDKVEFWVERHHMTHARYVSFTHSSTYAQKRVLGRTPALFRQHDAFSGIHRG